MKKIYLMLALLSAGVVQAQRPTTFKGQEVPQTVVKPSDVLTTPSPVQKPVSARPTSYSMGKFAKALKIGETQNDQQTNGTVYRHIYNHTGGKVAVTWTTSTDPSPYIQRGSGYQFFNGTSWLNVADASSRIEPTRCGFPCYAYNPTTNEEIITAHRVRASTETNAGAAGGLNFTRRTGIGSGAWNTTFVLDTTVTVPGILWAQTAIAGDYMHVFASYTDSSSNQPYHIDREGVRSPQVYSRYKFSTSTWEVKNTMLPDYSGRTANGGGDQYSIDAQGSNVAILIGGLSEDVSLWKSSDNGNTWTKTIIKRFAYAPYNYKKLMLDTPYTNDGCVSVVLDANNKAHCFWGRGRVLDTDTTDNSQSYFPGQTIIEYYTENLPDSGIRNVGYMPDANGNGTLDLGTNWNATGYNYGNHSITTMPSTSIGPDGTIYMVYTTYTEDDVSGDGKNFRDIYVVYSTDGGKTWSDAQNLSAYIGFNLEQVFASVSRNADDKLHITFLQKESIGRYDATNNPISGPFDIMYMSIETAFIKSGKAGVANVKTQPFMIGQNYPNPFTGITTIPMILKNRCDVTITVTDLTGRMVKSSSFKGLAAGTNEVQLDMSNENAGIYIYTVESEGFKVSNKLTVE